MGKCFPASARSTLTLSLTYLPSRRKVDTSCTKCLSQSLTGSSFLTNALSRDWMAPHSRSEANRRWIRVCRPSTTKRKQPKTQQPMRQDEILFSLCPRLLIVLHLSWMSLNCQVILALEVACTRPISCHLVCTRSQCSQGPPWTKSRENLSRITTLYLPI